MNNVKAIQKLNEAELKLGTHSKKSWHDMYSDSAYVFIGGLDYGLTEGDILSVFSQYGEIININLVRDKITGKPKGFCFLCYEDQRSTILAVDNFNGIKICGRTIRVDHVKQYRRPKDEDGNEIIERGCAPKTPTPSPTPSEPPSPEPEKVKIKKHKHKKKKKKYRHQQEKIDSEDEAKTPPQSNKDRTSEHKYKGGERHIESLKTATDQRLRSRHSDTPWETQYSRGSGGERLRYERRGRRRSRSRSPSLERRHKRGRRHQSRSRSRSRER